MLIQAGHFAKRVLEQAGDTPDEQVKTMYRIALSREPSSKELDSNVVFLKKQREQETALAALTDLAHVVLNLNEFAYIQ